MLMPAALTVWAASHVPVYLDMPETDSRAQLQVNKQDCFRLVFHTYHLALSGSNTITTSLPVIRVFVVSLKVQFSVLCSSSCTLSLSVLL